MVRRRKKTPRRAVLTWLVLASGLLIVTPHSVTRRLQLAFLDLCRLPIRSGRAIALSVQTTSKSTQVVAQADYETLLEQNRQLLNDLSTLEATVQQQQQQLDQLAGLRMDRTWERMALLPARVVTRKSPHHVLIDRGSADGLTQGHLVQASKAIIGRIVELGTRTAWVELATSPTSKLPVTVSSGVAGILCGLGDSRLMEVLVKALVSTALGDRVNVQKTSGLLAEPVAVGTVVWTGKDDLDPVLWEIRVQPSADLDRLDAVWVILPR